jgi:hypothetical protein
VVPANFNFKQNGKPVAEPGSTLTVALQKVAAGWRITGWAWSSTSRVTADRPVALLDPQVMRLVAAEREGRARLRTCPVGARVERGLVRHVTANDGVDRVSAGPGVLYFSRLIRLASRSRLTQLVSMPTYQSITVRYWNITTKLLQAMDRSRGGTGR